MVRITTGSQALDDVLGGMNMDCNELYIALTYIHNYVNQHSLYMMLINLMLRSSYVLMIKGELKLWQSRKLLESSGNVSPNHQSIWEYQIQYSLAPDINFVMALNTERERLSWLIRCVSQHRLTYINLSILYICICIYYTHTHTHTHTHTLYTWISWL